MSFCFSLLSINHNDILNKSYTDSELNLMSDGPGFTSGIAASPERVVLRAPPSLLAAASSLTKARAMVITDSQVLKSQAGQSMRQVMYDVREKLEQSIPGC